MKSGRVKAKLQCLEIDLGPIYMNTKEVEKQQPPLSSGKQPITGSHLLPTQQSPDAFIPVASIKSYRLLITSGECLCNRTQVCRNHLHNQRDNLQNRPGDRVTGAWI